MGWIIISIILALAWVVTVLVARGLRKEYKDDAEDVRLTTIGERVAFAAIFGLWLVITFFASAHQIEAGHVGIVYQFGSIEGQISEGLQFTTPWQGVRVADVRVQRAKFEHMSAASSETQDVFVTATLNYSVSPNAIQNLYRTVGPGWFSRLVEARVLNFFKDETARYRAVDEIPNREIIRTNVRERLIESLSPYSITVVDLLIDNISFNPEFTSAIEQKQVATQQALREEELVAVARHQAEQAVETAKGEAESIRVRAQGQADANRALNASLSPGLIQYTAIQNLSDNVSLVLVPESGNFLFNLNPQALSPGA